LRSILRILVHNPPSSPPRAPQSLGRPVPGRWLVLGSFVRPFCILHSPGGGFGVALG
jgi:hypothetical protein